MQITLAICSITMKKRKMRKKNARKDFLGCDEQPLWQKTLITTAIYLIKTLNILFTLFVFFIFVGTIHEMARYSKLYGIIFLCSLVLCLLLYDKFASDKISFKTTLILFIFSYWITYGLVLRYN